MTIPNEIPCGNFPFDPLIILDYSNDTHFEASKKAQS